MINKENFCKVLKDIENKKELENKINELLKYEDLMSFSFSNYEEIALNALCKSFDNFYVEDAIYYWVYDLEFGKKYTEDSLVKIDDNSPIDISTQDKLYDYIITLLQE